jgi:hypothetical protein
MNKMKLFLCLTMGALSIARADHHSDSEDIKEVTKAVHQMYELSNNLGNWESMISSKGSHHFFSSGGLLNFITNETKWTTTVEKNTIRPKHITILPIEPGKVAVAMFYAEGSEKLKGSPPVDHYMTRASVVFVKEKDSWKIRTMHWSPIAGGQGTSSVSMQD